MQPRDGLGGRAPLALSYQVLGGWQASHGHTHGVGRTHATVLLGCGTRSAQCGCRPAALLACHSTPRGLACAARTWHCAVVHAEASVGHRVTGTKEGRGVPLPAKGVFGAGSPPSPTLWLQCRGRRPGSSTSSRGRSSACPASRA